MKLKKTIIFIAILCICATPQSVFASTLGPAYTFKSVSNDDTSTTVNNSDTVSRSLYSSTLNSSAKASSSSLPVIYETDIGFYTLYCLDNGSYTNSKEFIRYLTTSWANSSQYVWNESQSTTWTYSGSVTLDVAKKIKAQLGLSSSRTTTYGVGVTIPADSTKFSKLGFYQDMFHQNVILKSVDDITGEITRYDSGSLVSPLEDSYLIVTYK
jgi:hypothetical protein